MKRTHASAGPDLFDAEYFQAGVLRQSRALTESAYERIALSWLDRKRPELRLGRNRRALEVGCGFGYAAGLLAARGYRVTATDVSPYAVARARADTRHASIEYHVWDATAEPPFDEGFSLIAAFQVLEHLAEPERAIASWRNLLEPGGALLATTPNLFGPLSRHWKDPTHVSVRSPVGWRRTLERSGGWSETHVSAVQWIPYVWRVDHVMRAFPLPLAGATLRLLAVKG